MAWIKIEQSLRDHHKICDAADQLGIEPAHMTGMMVLLWLWGVDNAQNGSLKGFSKISIARGAMYYGDAGQFVETLVNTGFLDRNEDGELAFHDWNEYTGKLMEKRARELNHKAELRKNSAEIPQNFHGISAELPQKFRRTSAEIPQSRVDKSRVEKSREEKEKIKTSLSPKTGERDESTSSTRQLPTPYEKIRELWNDTCLSLPKVREIVGKRQKMLGARWKDHPDLDWWTDYFDRIQASSFLTGKNDRGWKAKFDWVLEPANLNKVLEGNYDDRKEAKSHERTAEDFVRGFSS